MKKKLLLISLYGMFCSNLLLSTPSSTNSIVSRIYGKPFVPSVPSKAIGEPGTLDLTFASGGYENLNAQMTNGVAVTVQALENGDFLVVLETTGVNSIIAKYNAQGVLQTSSYGVGGIVDLGANSIYPCAGMIDSQGRMIVGGGDVPGTLGWISRVSADGLHVTPFDVGSSWEYFNFLGQQTTGKIIACGANQTCNQLARFHENGTIDTKFGTNGFVVFDGTSLPSVIYGFDFVIDADDFIYVTYVDADFNVFVAKFTPSGSLDTGWATNGIQSISFLSPAAKGWEAALDLNNNLVITAIVGNNINVTAISAATGGSAIPSFSDTVISVDDQELTIGGIVGTINQMHDDIGSIIIIGTNRTINKQIVCKLNSRGGLDSTFNHGLGYVQFSAIVDGPSAYLGSISLAQNGQIYVCGQEANSENVVSPYVYKLYNTLSSEIPLYPSTSEQGNRDTTFGLNEKQTYPGVVTPFLGKYRGNLQQHVTSILEIGSGTVPAAGDILVGMYGTTDSSLVHSMMLNWFTPEGMLDTNVGTNGSGQLILNNATSGAHEYLYAMAQGSSGSIYVVGHADGRGATLRKYSSAGTSAWTVGTADWSVTDSSISINAAAVGVALQGADLILMFKDFSNGTGAIVGYDPATGHLANGVSGAPTFGATGSGTIQTASYSGMHMGPVYGGVVNEFGEIFVAYINSSTHRVDLASFKKNGSALVSDFGSSGIVSNVFGLTGTVSDATSVHLAFDAFGNLIVTTVDSSNSHILMMRVSQVNGAIDRNFGVNGIVTIPLTNPVITQVQGISDGSIIMTGYTTASHKMYILRVTSQGVLDTSFDSQGAQPGVFLFNVTDNPYRVTVCGGAVQSSSGNIVFAGNENLSNTASIPMVMRIFGMLATTAVKNYPVDDQYLGSVDISFGSIGGYNLSTLVSQGTAKVLYTYPFGTVYEGMLLVGIDTGDVTHIIRVNSGSLRLDETFNAVSSTPGIYTASLPGVSAILVDANNRIVFGGDHDGIAWAQRLTQDGVFDADFDMSANLSHLVSITSMGQQKSGRYIFAGQADAHSGSIGLVVAYQDELVRTNRCLKIDRTFNPMGSHGSIGQYNIDGAEHSFYSIAINADDTILVGYADSATLHYASIKKLTANGSGLVTSFGSSGRVTTAIIPSAVSTVRMAIDAVGKIIIGASFSGTELKIVRYTTAGSVDSTWNSGRAVTLSGQVTTVSGFGYSVALTDLVISKQGQVLLLGHNMIRRVNGINGPIFAVSLNTTGVLDTTWNPHGFSSDVPGILTYSILSSTIMSKGAFSVNGDLFTVGGTGTDPLLMKIVADGLPASQSPLAGAVGILDTTINTQDTGTNSLELDLKLGIIAGLPMKLHLMDRSNGSMIMAAMPLIPTHTCNIVKINADLSLDTRFNASSSHPGYLAISSISTIEDLFVADAPGDTGTIYATGKTTGSSIWAQMISADGATQTALTAANSLTQAHAIRQGNGNVLIAGYAGSTGIIAAFSSDLSELDPSFGTNGYYTTNVNGQILAMTVDKHYRIYIAHFDGTHLFVQRILADGSGIDGSFNASVIVPLSAAQIQLALDDTHNQLVVAFQNGTSTNNNLSVARYHTFDGSGTGTSQLVTILGKTLNLSDLFLDTDQNIYVVGYNKAASPYQVVVARFNSINSTSIALDLNYAAAGATPGIANTAISPLNFLFNSIGAAILHPDRRVYVVGSTILGINGIARFFGDNYFDEVSNAISINQPGEIDYSYGQEGSALTFASSGLQSPLAGQQVKAVAHLHGLKLMTVVDDGIHSWTVRLLQDGTNDPDYGPTPGGQGALIAKKDGLESVAAMIVSGAGQYYVTGTNSTTGTGYLKKMTATGDMDQAFGGNSRGHVSSHYPIGTLYGLMSHPVALAELTDGNIVIVGNDAGVGKIQMVSATGVKSTTFGDSGSFVNGHNIRSVVVDSSNNLYVAVAYLQGEDKAVRVMKLHKDGLPVTSFGLNGTVNNVLSGIADYNNVQLALDISGNIFVVGTVAATPGEFAVVKLLINGDIDSSFNDGNRLIVTLPNATTAVANIAKIMPLQNGKILIAGHQQDNDTLENNVEFVVSITETGELDPLFNQYGGNGLIPGISTFQILSGMQQNRAVYDMDVQANGVIVLAGSESLIAGQPMPLTTRLIGYAYDQAVAQYPGYVPVVPTVLNLDFNRTGIATTIVHDTLVAGGDVAVDSLGNVIVAGRTSAHELMLSRFLPDGTFDTTFGIDGVGISAPIGSDLLQGGFVSIDSLNNVYVGGITTMHEFVVAKFLPTGLVDSTPGHFGTNGIATSPVVTNLISGGYVAIDSVGNVIITGYSSDKKLIAARFTAAGLLDTGNFNSPTGIVKTGVISRFHSGGYVTIDSSDRVYVGGSTDINTLVVARCTAAGILDTDHFGTAGIATVGISNLVAGGTIVDTGSGIVVAGYTLDETFAVAQLTYAGLLDPEFNEVGITYSEPVSNLLGITEITVGALNNIIVGGYARDYSGSNSLVAAVFTMAGRVNTLFSATGTGSTGDIADLASGGFITINQVNQIITGGIILGDSPRLVVSDMLSGYETFIADPAILSPIDQRTFYYGNTLDYVLSVLNIPYFARYISDATVRQDVTDRVTTLVEDYVAAYTRVSGFNVTWHLFLQVPKLNILESSLGDEHVVAREEIRLFFNALLNRIHGLQLA